MRQGLMPAIMRAGKKAIAVLSGRLSRFFGIGCRAKERAEHAQMEYVNSCGCGGTRLVLRGELA
jgi:hypothetical protein